MDQLRAYQKKENLDGRRNKRGVFGCYCCRKFRSIRRHKKYTMSIAKRRLRKETTKEIGAALDLVGNDEQ